jgi:DNA polymerase-3 subunit delta'
MWDKVYGHEENKKFLSSLLVGQLRTPGLLFYGPDGVGKKLLALNVAQSFLCLDPLPNGEACNECGACKSFLAGGHPDFIHVSQLKEGKDILIEQIKDVAKHSETTPQVSKYKVCIIEGADFMNKYGANSILKLIEEPPKYWVFILIANNRNRILPTILSRVIQLRFQGLPEELMVKLLAKGEDLGRLYSRLSSGSLGRARTLIETNGLEWRDRALKLLIDLPNETPVNYSETGVDWLKKPVAKQEGLLFFEFLLYLLRDLIYIKENLFEKIINIDKIPTLKRIESKWSVKKIEEIILAVQESHRAIAQHTVVRSVVGRIILVMNQRN